MWTPQERIRHPLPDSPWPDAEEAARSRWFSPLPLGKVTAERRTWVPAMVPWRATEDGEVTPDVLDWYGRFAEGRPGVLVVEATGIRDVPSGPLLRASHDRFIPGLTRLAQRVREASAGKTVLLLQIIDFLSIRRRPEKSKYFQRFLAINPRHRRELARLTGEGSWLTAPEGDLRHRLEFLSEEELPEVLTPREMEALRMGARERVTDLHLPHILALPRVLPGLFAEAAHRALQAGFHGVELHYAHAYTMASFLSATNTRGDGYGGSREGRLRLPLEVLAEVKSRAGAGVVGLRLLGDEAIAGGSTVEDAAFFGVAFARAGIDYLSVSKGGKFDDAQVPKVGEAAYPYTGPSGYECMPTVISDATGPFSRNVPLPAAIRHAVREAGYAVPVVAAGGISTFEQAEGILARGQADAVASARQTLADPDWFEKVRLGRGSEVRRCEFTNYCEGLDQRHKQVTCKLWDRIDLDAEGTTRDHSGRRRLIPPPWVR